MNKPLAIDLHSHNLSVKRDLENPKSSYHVWLESGAPTMSRSQIISLQPGQRAMQQGPNVTGQPSIPDRVVSPTARGSKRPVPESTSWDNKVSIDVPTSQGNAHEQDIDESDESTITDRSDSDEPEIKVYRPPNDITVTNHLQPSFMSNRNEAKVFEIMANIRWRDRDESRMTISNLRHTTVAKFKKIFPTMLELASVLYKKISAKTRALDGLDTVEKYNFLFHVVAKGQAFYDECNRDPLFCLYLLDQWQPLFTLICEKINHLTSNVPSLSS